MSFAVIVVVAVLAVLKVGRPTDEMTSALSGEDAEEGARRSTLWTTETFSLSEGSGIVTLNPGDDAQAIIDQNPPGTTFLFAPGIYQRLELSPRSRDVFVGRNGAILDGEGTAVFAFAAHDPKVPTLDVTIRGLVIRDYATPLQLGTVGGGGAVGWIIQGNEISQSLGAAIETASRMIVRDNYLHDNAQLGIHGGAPASGVLIEGNEIAFNNPQDLHDMAWEAGGVKVTQTRDLVVRGNFVHDNGGPGLWTDRDNVDSIFEGNLIIDNDGPGILHEISYHAVIRDNVVRRNAHTFFVGGILVLSSVDVEVFGNELRGNNGGVAGINDERGEGLFGTYEIDNLWVHDNIVEQDAGWTGVRDSTGRGVDAQFDRNTYEVGSQIQPFYWLDTYRTRQQWMRLGQDRLAIWDDGDR